MSLALAACGGDPGSPQGGLDESSGAAVDTDDAEAGSSAGESTTGTTAVDESTSGETAAESSTGEPELPPPDPDPVFGAFAWPVDAWISATDFYQTGSPHSGSADLSGPYWTPVGASRAGTVVESRWTTIGGYLVRIDHGDGYRTLYSHLTEPPIVEEGDAVETNEVIGYLGRTGNAFRGGAHVHFSIQYNGDRQIIPTLDFAQWVQRGQPIPGDWTGLDTIELPHETFDVRVIGGSLPVFEGPAQDEAIAGVLLEDEVVTVRGSDRGYYRIWHAGAEGWIVHSATQPVGSQLFGVKVVPSTASVYAEPNAGAEVVGSMSAGDLVTVFGQDDDYYRFLFDLPTTYEWLRVADVEPSPQFRARVRASSVNVRTGPGIEHDAIGSLAFFDTFTVHEVQDGWYRLTYDDQDAWIAGWLTSGRL
jgi:hypothetical protein